MAAITLAVAGCVPKGLTANGAVAPNKCRLLTPRGYLVDEGNAAWNLGSETNKNPDLLPYEEGSPANRVLLYEQDYYLWCCQIDTDGITTRNHRALTPTTGRGWLEPRWDRWSGGRSFVCTHDVGTGSTPETLELYRITLNSGAWTDATPDVTRTRLTTETSTPAKYRPEAAADGRVWFTRGVGYSTVGIAVLAKDGTITQVVTAPSDGSSPAFDTSLDRHQERVYFGQGGRVKWFAVSDPTTITTLARPDGANVDLPRASHESDLVFFRRNPSGEYNGALWYRQPDGSFRSLLALDANLTDSFVVATLQD